MAKVNLLPGFGFVQESAVKQNLLPGFGFVNETFSAPVSGGAAVPVFMHHYMQQRGA